MEQDLSPVFVRRVREDPALIVFRLYDKHAEPGDEDVINLRRAITHPNRDVVHQVIVRRAEFRKEDARHQRLATVLESEGVERAEALATANEEAKGYCSCQQNVEYCPIASTQ